MRIATTILLCLLPASTHAAATIRSPRAMGDPANANAVMVQPEFVSVYLHLKTNHPTTVLVQSPKAESVQRNGIVQFAQVPFWSYPSNLSDVKEVRIYYAAKGQPLTNHTRIIPPAASALVTLKPHSEYKFCAAAVGKSGKEGARSPVVSYKTPWR